MPLDTYVGPSRQRELSRPARVVGVLAVVGILLGAVAASSGDGIKVSQCRNPDGSALLYWVADALPPEIEIVRATGITSTSTSDYVEIGMLAADLYRNGESIGVGLWVADGLDRVMAGAPTANGLWMFDANEIASAATGFGGPPGWPTASSKAGRAALACLAATTP